MANLEKKVIATLRDYAYTRDDDLNLTIRLWQTFFPGYCRNGKITMSDFRFLPSQSDIQRLRAKIQNDLGQYPPTHWKVAQKRKMKRAKWERYLEAA